MDSTRVIAALRPTASSRSAVLIVAITAAIAASEAALFAGRIRYAIWTYSLLLIGLTLAPLLFEEETPLFSAFALLPVFRLVNLAMPIFLEVTLLWLPLVYGPFLPVFAYLGWRGSTNDAAPSTAHASVDATGHSTETRDGRSITAVAAGLPWWLGGTTGGKGRWLYRRLGRALELPDDDLTFPQWLLYTLPRAFLVVCLPVAAVVVLASLVVLVVYLAEIQYAVTTPAPLIPSLTVPDLALLAVVMIGFVGVVEELLFRGILQKALERRLGVVLGLLLASGLFGLMHSAYGTPAGIIYAAGLGLLLGVLYDATDSLVLVAVLHGLANVLLFGVLPLTGVSPIGVLRDVAVRELGRGSLGWPHEALSLLGPWLLGGWI